MTLLRTLWPLRPSQWWRWRYPDLWCGRSFDPYNAQQVMSYTVMRLPTRRRDVFLLNAVQALDYSFIARHMGLSVEEVRALFAAALIEVSRTVDLIERRRPASRPLPNPERSDVR